LALNGLELAIRHSTGYKTGRVPLLKTMIAKLHPKDLARVCALLLLPTGINLQSLLWHGFVAANLPQPWLALVLILTKMLHLRQSQDVCQEDDVDAVEVLKLRAISQSQHL
jgi:hypothetical protein